MDERPIFRCPFEVHAAQNGAILSASLGLDEDERLSTAKRLLAGFYADTRLVGLRFVCEGLREGVSALPELKLKIVPYQCALLAAELDYRLDPFLPYQAFDGRKASGPEDGFMRLTIAQALTKAMLSTGGAAPASARDIAAWLRSAMLPRLRRGEKSPLLVIQDTLGKPTPVLRINLGNVAVPHTYIDRLTDPDLNRNLFGLVKCPFYPEGFGRFSRDVEIVLSREAHFISVPMDARRQIRRSSNQVLRHAGVAIADLAEDKQNLGLWVP